MFERFTARARKTGVLAQEEASRLGHGYLGAEHLLLGHLREEEGVAACVLRSLGSTVDGAREQVENIVGRGEEGKVGQATFAPCAKKVLELALSEAVQIRHSYIGTEHILLGLVRKPKGAAARVLSNLGVDLDGGRPGARCRPGAARTENVRQGRHGPCGGLENEQEGIPGTGGGARDPSALRCHGRGTRRPPAFAARSRPPLRGRGEGRSLRDRGLR